jgi:membrane protease YdiL (CAAX protease family)
MTILWVFQLKKMARHEAPSMPFVKTRKALALHILLVLAPSAVLLLSGRLLLLGLLLSLTIAWIGMRLQGTSWSDLGLRRPRSIRTVLMTAGLATVGLLPATYVLRLLVTEATSRGPNLEAFQSIKGNIAALSIGLLIVWTFAAFGEELLFRGFLMNAFFRLMEGSRLGDRAKWAIVLVVTSILVGLGHAYQGLTGMILTTIIAVGFGALYLFWGRNLWPSILTHGLYDTAAFINLFQGLRPDSFGG